MLPISEKIRRSHPIRRRTRQKDAFIAALQTAYPALRVETNGQFHSRNLILGDPETAALLLTAHYDTAAASLFPNVVMPYRRGLKFCYSLLTALPLVLIGLLALIPAVSRGMDGVSIALMMFFLYYALFCGKLFLLPPNRNNQNDNTSGVITLLEIWEALNEDDRAKAALVFFDHEEYGCLGSRAYHAVHREMLQEKLVLNFDCVGDGEVFLFVQSKPAENRWQETLRAHLLPDAHHTVVLDTQRNANHSSDHRSFPCGVAVSAMHEHPRLGLYFSRIHTHRDTVLREENIRFLRDRISALIKNL